MASALPPFPSTKGTANYARLCRLLVDVGSQVLRETFERVRPPGNLHKVLSDPAIHAKLQSLRKKRVLNASQWGKLYPAIKSSVSSRDFDTTLLVLLLRNVCGLTPPATGWDNLPLATDITPEADVARIKFFRNTVYGHATDASVDDPTFSSYWNNVKDTLLRAGGAHFQNAIDDLETDCMDLDLEEHYRELLIKWVKDDDCVKDILNEEEMAKKARKQEDMKESIEISERNTGMEGTGINPVENRSAQNGSVSSPGELSIELPKMADLPKISHPWKNVELPVDILLLTVEDCEFLGCFAYLEKPFRSYDKSIGYVYFGCMGNDQEKKIKIALIRCSKGSVVPGGSLSAVKDAITLLRPKATFSVGACKALNSRKVKLGDVVVSSKLLTAAHKTPPGRNIGNLIRHVADGWMAPLQNPDEHKVNVHCGVVLSISEPDTCVTQCCFEDIIRQHPEAIAVEMEGGGMFAAAHDFKTEWVVVKGIKDFADGSQSSNEKWEYFASVMAASVVANILSDPVIFQDWPHYNEGNNESPTPGNVHKKMKRLESNQQNTESRTRLVEDRVNVVEDKVNVVKDKVNVVEDKVNVVEDKVNVVEDKVNIVEDKVNVVEDKVNVVEDKVNVVEDKVNVVEDKVNLVEDKLNVVEDKLDVVEDSVHHLQEQVHDLSKAKESNVTMLCPESPKSADHPEELAEIIRRKYKGAALCPFPWCEDELQMELSKIFTRLKIVGRKKERARLTEDIVNMTDAFRAHEECEKPRVVLIEGEPGMGKTTYCQKLAYDWSVEDISPEASFPKVNMLLKLKCRDMKTANIEDALDDQLLPFDLDQKDKGNFFRFIRGNQSRILLVLDGLDELPQDLFEGLLPLIKGRVFPNVYLMLTARHEAGTKVRQHCDTLLEIVGYTNKDANSFIEKYFSKHDDPSLGEKLIQLLDRDPELRELTANPLNTALLCLVYEDAYGIFPYNKTMLYHELVSCVLTRTFSKKGIPLPDNKGPIEVCTDQLNLLGKLALEALLKDQLAFTPGQLSQSTEFLEFGFLSREASASKIKPKPAYSFTHKSFQEYFAAFYLAHELLTGESDKAALLAQLSPVDKYWQVWEFLITMAASKSDEIADLLMSSLCALFERKLPEGFYRHNHEHDDGDVEEDVCRDTSYEWDAGSSWKWPGKEELFLTKTIYTIAQCEQPQSELKLYQKEMAATLARHIPLDTITVSNRYDDTSFASRYILLLSECLKGNYQLRGLSWRKKLDEFALAAIANVLQSNHQLTHLHLCDDLRIITSPNSAIRTYMTFTGSNLACARSGVVVAKALGEVLQSNRSLTHLYLPGNKITHIGAEALAKGLLSNNVLVHLDIRDNPIGDQGAVALSQSLESNRTLSYLNVGIKELTKQISLSFYSWLIRDSGITAIAHALRSNNSLSYLDIRGNKFSDSTAAALGEALQSNCSLTHLYLRGFEMPNHFGNSAAAAFSKALQSHDTQLTCLDLHNTSISCSCVITLAEGLQSNRTLESLDLSENEIECSGAAALAQALKTNQTLTHLQLRQNKIRDSGAKEFVEALQCNETLIFLDLVHNPITRLGKESFKALSGVLHTDLTNFPWASSGVRWTRN